jgi:hypothetical protein
MKLKKQRKIIHMDIQDKQDKFHDTIPVYPVHPRNIFLLVENPLPSKKKNVSTAQE